MKERPLFIKMSDDIAEAIGVVIGKYKKEIKKQKCPKGLLLLDRRGVI